MAELPYGIKEHFGWHGAFTRQQAKGALPSGTVVIKIAQDPSDGTKLGTRGVVLGSILEPRVHPDVMYFIEWDDKPMVAVACIGWKIAPAGR